MSTHLIIECAVASANFDVEFAKLQVKYEFKIPDQLFDLRQPKDGETPPTIEVRMPESFQFEYEGMKMPTVLVDHDDVRQQLEAELDRERQKRLENKAETTTTPICL